MSGVNRVERLLHFSVDRFLERVRGLLESRLNQRRVLLQGERRILVEVVDNPALAFGDRLRAELFARQVIAPIAERALRELLDVALVHQRHALALVPQRVPDGPPHQPLRSRRGNRLDAHAGVPANLLFPILQHLVIQEFKQLLRFRRAGFPFDPDVDIFGILPEDEYIHFFRLAHRRRHARKITDRPLAGIQIQDLPQRHVQRANTSAHGSRQRPLDGHAEIPDGVDGIARQPLLEGVEGLLPGEDFEPRHPPLPAVSVLHRRVEHSP